MGRKEDYQDMTGGRGPLPPARGGFKEGAGLKIQDVYRTFAAGWQRIFPVASYDSVTFDIIVGGDDPSMAGGSMMDFLWSWAEYYANPGDPTQKAEFARKYIWPYFVWKGLGDAGYTTEEDILFGEPRGGFAGGGYFRRAASPGGNFNQETLNRLKKDYKAGSLGIEQTELPWINLQGKSAFGPDKRWALKKGYVTPAGSPLPKSIEDARQVLIDSLGLGSDFLSIENAKENQDPSTIGAYSKVKYPDTESMEEMAIAGLAQVFKDRTGADFSIQGTSENRETFSMPDEIAQSATTSMRKTVDLYTESANNIVMAEGLRALGYEDIADKLISPNSLGTDVTPLDMTKKLGFKDVVGKYQGFANIEEMMEQLTKEFGQMLNDLKGLVDEMGGASWAAMEEALRSLELGQEISGGAGKFGDSEVSLDFARQVLVRLTEGIYKGTASEYNSIVPYTFPSTEERGFVIATFKVNPVNGDMSVEIEKAEMPYDIQSAFELAGVGAYGGYEEWETVRDQYNNKAIADAWTYSNAQEESLGSAVGISYDKMFSGMLPFIAVAAKARKDLTDELKIELTTRLKDMRTQHPDAYANVKDASDDMVNKWKTALSASWTEGMNSVKGKGAFISRIIQTQQNAVQRGFSRGMNTEMLMPWIGIGTKMMGVGNLPKTPIASNVIGRTD